MLKFLIRITQISRSLGVAILLLGFGNLSAHASPDLLSLKFPDPQGNVGAPRATAGGGVRSGGGQCLGPATETSSLQALIPAFLLNPKTTFQTPTLFFNLPENKGHTGEIVLENILGEKIYHNRLQLPPQGGIIATTFAPSTALETDGLYKWSLRIICNPAEPSQDIFLKGSFEYVDRPAALPEIPKSLLPRPADPQGVTPEMAQTALAIANQYAQGGLWLDSLNLVSFAYGAAPQEWEEMLVSVGLDGLKGVPLQDCCRPAMPK